MAINHTDSASEELHSIGERPLHENITRNHRCKDLAELLDQVFAWLGARNPFEIEGSVYPKAKAA
jgi:hypothetical protein